ncbi:hypothetical protein FH972_018760 [Carpinus fangiana]|uniref:Uncharacterized protein n=1 Tax=Carpinus fangiana TaxID=176857 RepID=A0A5N6RPI4_9ROSI|nr:hypothetical protein FH972_018760 [Carpinus fangiana]
MGSLGPETRTRSRPRRLRPGSRSTRKSSAMPGTMPPSLSSSSGLLCIGCLLLLLD